MTTEIEVCAPAAPQSMPTVVSATALTPTTPATLLEIAVRSGATTEQLGQLMALQERWEANEARKLFNAAFADFKAAAVQIIKAKQIKDGPLKGKFHAELSDVVNAVTPELSRHRLAMSWRLTKDDRDWMEVTCTLSHAAGHSETVSMGGPPDAGPGRNAMQARGSTKTYLERYTATAILGLAAQEADDDGAGGAPDPRQQEVQDWIARAHAAKSHAELNVVVRGGVAAFAKDKRSFNEFRMAVEAHRLTLPQ